MMNCFHFCSIFAFQINLRCYTGGPWLPLASLEGFTGAAGVVHVRVGGVLAALEEALMPTGRRRCTLRSLATFCNHTAVPLQICLAPAGRPPRSSSSDPAPGPGPGPGPRPGSSSAAFDSKYDPGGMLVTEVWPVIYCSPRHGMSFNSRDEGSKCV